MPLKDLDSYGAGADEGVAGDSSMGGTSTGGVAAIGGLGGAGGEVSGPVCGDGVVEGYETCDDGGPTAKCSSKCSSRKCVSGCQCWMEGGDLITFCTAAPVAFKAAAQSCALADAVLNLPESVGENNRLSWTLATNDYSSVWLGANDMEDEGVWVDGAGHPFWQGDSTGEAVDGHFVAWESTQPDDHLQAQDCAFLHDTGAWDDQQCGFDNVYSCRVSAGVPSKCGDGKLDSGEACDGKGDTADCDADCTVARCGDGYRNSEAEEECDDGESGSDGCTTKCLSTGFVAHFPLTERRGPAAHDVMDFTRSARLMGDATFTDAGDGAAFNLAGSISVESASAPKITGKITVMAFIRPEALPTGYEDIVELHSTVAETWLRFNGSTLEVGSWDNGSAHSAKFEVTTALVPGAYVHVAGTHDGASWQLYLDGQLVAETASVTGAIPPDGPLVIGGRGDLSRGFQGKIVDVRLYEKALTQGEIQAISDALHQTFP